MQNSGIWCPANSKGGIWQHQTAMRWLVAVGWLCLVASFSFGLIVGPSSALAARPARRMLEVARCVLNSTTYHPSAHEKAWTENVGVWADPSINESTYCATMAPMIADAQLWLPRLNTMMAPGHFSMSLDAEQSKHFSHFTYSYGCSGGHMRHLKVPIEPLVGGLRHPFFPCLCDDGVNKTTGVKGDKGWWKQRWNCLLKKDYLLLASAFAAPYSMQAATAGKVYIFDLGASVYNAGV